MASPLDKMPAEGTPEHAQLMREMAVDMRAMEIRDAARLLASPGALDELCSESPSLFDELDNAVRDMVTELRGGSEL